MASQRLPRTGVAGALLAGSLVALWQPALASAAEKQVAIAAASSAPANATPVAVVNPKTPLDLTIGLAPHDQAALAAFVATVSTQGSPQYRKFLAPGEFAARFGAPPQVIARVTDALRERGLQVGPVDANGLSIPASGTAAAVGAAFHTSFAAYRLSSGRTVLANTRPATLPSSVASSVQGVLGLDQATQATPLSARAGASVTPAAVGPTACPAATTAAANLGAYVPAQIAHHYGIDSLYNTTTGRGSTVALFELEPFAASDVAAYQSCFGTTTSVSVRQVDGGAGAGAGSGQAASDVQTVIGLAPGASVIVYEAPNDAASVYDQFRQIANDDSAAVVSDSWGVCEQTAGAAQLAALERPLFQQMAAQGQTVLAATGDSGSEGCWAPPGSSNTSLSVWEPASQPEVTAVGGTSVASADAADTAWNNATGASGGGVSALWTMPAYQRNAGNIPGSSGAPCGAASGQLCRETPDVSVSADFNHGSLAYYNGGWQRAGGTKTAAPTWAAIVALVDASCPAGPVGFMNPALYALGDAAGSPLVDVASGPNNDFAHSNGGLYPVRPGYDMTSGLGRPNVSALATSLCPSVATPGSGTVTISPQVVATSTTATLNFSYTPGATSGTPTGMVDGEFDVTIPGTWTLPTTSPTDPGYTTASAGTVSIVGNTVIVRGVTLPAGAALTVTYGDTSGGAAPAQTPSFAQVSVFTALSRNGKAGASAPLTIAPAVRVLAPNGLGAGTGTLTRIAGPDRIATAVATSKTAFPTSGSAHVVVLARDDTFPDALAGVPLAAQAGGPLLLTPTSGLTAVVAAEIQRVLPPGSTVYVLGGPTSLSPAVEQQLRAMGYAPERVAGTTRFDTAVAIAHLLGDPSVAFEADGLNFPDALAAGAAAAAVHGAVLLTAGKQPAGPTTAFLADHPGETRYAVGGAAANADPTAQPFVGVDRYATAVLVAEHFFNNPQTIGVASGLVFPDALAGGPLLAFAGGPMLLVPTAGALPKGTQQYLSGIAASVGAGWVLGGTPSVSTGIANQVAQSLVLVPPPT